MYKLHGKCYSKTIVCEECKKKILFMKDSWNKSFWDRMNSKESLKARLLPLNKVHPKTPTIEKYRPIIMFSPLVKFCELICKPKLEAYNQHHIQKEQVGFVRGFSTNFNLTRLLNNIWKIKKKKKKRKPIFMLFVDFKGAYDSVNRNYMYEILQRNNILNSNELQLLKFFHSKAEIWYDDASCKSKAGVPQGSNISPLLFNIVLNELMIKLKERLRNRVDLYGYADDLLIVAKDLESIKSTIDTIKLWGKESNLKLNKKKCGLIILFDKKEYFKEVNDIEGVPRVTSYKYLGLIIDDKLKFDIHIKKMRKKIRFICTKLRFLFKKSSIKFRRNCFELFVSPLFLYILGPLFYFDVVVKKQSILPLESVFQENSWTQQKLPK